MIFFILAQIVGAIGLIFNVVSYHYRKKSKILTMQLTSSFCYIIQYLFLGAYSGLASKILAVARTSCVIKKDKYRKQERWLLYIFIGMYITMAFVTFEKWYSIFSIAAGLIYTIVIWSEKNPQIIRKTSCFCSILWLIYNICVLSIPGIIKDISEILSASIAIFRYQKKKLSKRNR